MRWRLCCAMTRWRRPSNWLWETVHPSSTPSGQGVGPSGFPAHYRVCADSLAEGGSSGIQILRPFVARGFALPSLLQKYQDLTGYVRKIRIH